MFITLKGPSQPTLDAAKAAGAVTINVGLFLNAVIQFLIVGFAVFWMVKLLSRLYVKKAPDVMPTASELLLTDIRDLLAAQSGTSTKA